MYAWVRHEWRQTWGQRIPPRRDGRASILDDKKGVVRVRHVVGFTREDWGEGNWTAKDLR